MSKNRLKMRQYFFFRSTQYKFEARPQNVAYIYIWIWSVTCGVMRIHFCALVLLVFVCECGDDDDFK